MRVDARLGRRDAALVDQALDERVVRADLRELAAAQAVDAGVADVGEGELLAVPQQGVERRAHALDSRIVGDEVAQPGVGLGDGLLERRHRVGVEVVGRARG